MKPSIIFFGTSSYAVMVLETLISSGYVPILVVTTPDKPAGKHLSLTPPPVKVAALKHNLSIIQPENLKDPNVFEHLSSLNPDLSIVVAYGKILPQTIIDIPKYKTLNLHASLLPKLRGPSPIETSILNDDKNTGVTIMTIDSEMDHGPIVAQKEVSVEPWPPLSSELGKILVGHGAELLVTIIPQWIKGEIKAKEQDHSKATYSKMIEKKDGLIDLADDPYKNYLKIRSFSTWPTAYFFAERKGKKIRVIIKDAEYKDGTLTLLRVVPEGKKEMSYEDFKKSLL